MKKGIKNKKYRVKKTKRIKKFLLLFTLMVFNKNKKVVKF